ncbi:MAG: phosphohistidine phosphatase SixA [Kiritimatiellae bacterium]|nr:phosphohistidine phosphatase SixA [Kiritimatiellia bacterium]
MELYLMQHGAALSEEQDPERPLSEEGTIQITTSAKAMAKMGLTFELIVASTKKRSRQTAELVAAQVGYAPDKIVETDEVKPSATPEQSVEFLGQFSIKPTVFIAGHMPNLKRIASYLLSEGPELDIHFVNGGLCRIDLDHMRTRTAQLVYALPRHMLALVAGG